MRIHLFVLLPLLLACWFWTAPATQAVILPDRAHDEQPTLLPGGCIRVSPPGFTPPVCCISGYVYLEGAPLAGAQITTETDGGEQAVVMTRPYLDSPTPHYRLDLSRTLNVLPGETITLTAHFENLMHTLTYTVRAGGQQVDLLLPTTRHGFAFLGQVQGQAPHGHFNTPVAVAVDGQGYLYVVDQENARIQKLEPSGRFVLQWGQQGRQDGSFSEPDDIAIDRWSNVYVADKFNHHIQKFSGDGAWLATVGEAGDANGAFNQPQGVAVDQDGNLYVADSENRRLQRFDHNLVWQQSIPMPIVSTTLKPAKPLDIAVDGAGNLYVLDDAERLHKLSSSGQLLLSVGKLGNANGEFFNPLGVAVDDADSVYITDTDNRRVQVFQQSDLAWQRTWAEPIRVPHDLAVDKHGWVYVADEAGHPIKRYTLDGVLVSQVGQEGDRSDSDLSNILDFTVDSQGKLFVSDFSDQGLSATRIKVYHSDGARQPDWGNVGLPNDSFYRALAVDSADRLFALNTVQGALQRFNSDGVAVAQWPIAGAGIGGSLAVSGETLLVSPAKNSQMVQQFTTSGITETVTAYPGEIAGLAAVSPDLLLAVDSANQQIMRRQSNGTWQPWTTPGGAPIVGGALAADESGYLYLTAGNQLKMYTHAGELKVSLAVTQVGDFPVTQLGALKLGAGGQLYVLDASNTAPQRLFRYQPLHMPAEASAPLATINHIAATSLTLTETLHAVGMGQDSDATDGINAYRWRLAGGGGELGNQAELNLPAGRLGAGLHTVEFLVQDNEGQWSPAVAVEVLVTAPPPPTARWTILLYLAGDYADNEHLWRRFMAALGKLERELKQPHVQIAVQVDGPGSDDTQRRLIRRTPETGQMDVTSESLGERAMDDPNQLAGFIRWGKAKASADYYYLVVANHGQAVRGIAWDYTSDRADGLVDEENRLTVKALGQALTQPGVQPIHLLHLDACSMNLLETAYELQAGAQVLIASQYLGWDIFPYSRYANAIGINDTPRQVAQQVVNVYADVLNNYHYPYTLSALDLRQAPTVTARLDALVNRLDELAISQKQLADAWEASQKLDSNNDYRNDANDAYVDLLDWSRQLRTKAPAVTNEAAVLADAVGGMVLYSRSASYWLPAYYQSFQVGLEHSHGLSIFYPRYRNQQAHSSYLNHELFRFSELSRWSNFLAGVPSGSEPLGRPFGGLPTVLSPLTAPTTPPRIFLPLMWR